jgi:hypothetical protein
MWTVPNSGRLKAGVAAGLKSGWRSFIWMARVVIPVSLLVALFQWSGWLDNVDKLFAPLMSLLRLPAEAALPLLSGMVVNIYAAIAALTVMNFSVPQMTIIAVFALICHNLILEGIVQQRSGFNAFKAILLRLGTAIVTAFAVSRFFTGTAESAALPANMQPHASLGAVVEGWVSGTGVTLLKIFAIIMVIMIVLEVSRKLGWIDHVSRFFRPVMKVFGTGEKTTVMFVAGILFGLLYGGALIMEESRTGNLSRADVARLQTSLGINHGIVEDPALFAALGVNLLWLLVPRLVVAIAAVQILRLGERLFQRNGHVSA